MTTDPLHNPGPSASQPTQGPLSAPSPNQEAEADQPRPFSLPPEPLQGSQTTPQSQLPTPMDLAREGTHSQQWTSDELNDNLTKLQTQVSTAHTNLQDPNVTKDLTEDHYSALSQVANAMNPSMRSIAKYTNTDFSPPNPEKSGGLKQFLLQWLNGSQQTLTNALRYTSTISHPDPVSMLKLQYSVQRATQRGELFASIIGSSVSGIKTIMSTQLG